jgi:diaminopimelate decarboxylase
LGDCRLVAHQAVGQGSNKGISVTFSGVFHSVLSSATRRPDVARGQGAAEQAELRRCEMYRKSFPTSEVAIPASALQNRAVAKWVRDHRLSVEIRTGEDIAVAIAAGIDPAQMTVHADGLTESDLRATVSLAPGRIVVSSIAHIDLLAAAVEHRTQAVLARVIDGNAPALALADGRYTFHDGFRLDSTELDRVVESLFNYSRLDLVGLYCDVGTYEHDFVSYPAAIGQLITEMTQIRRQHGVVLPLLGLGGGRAIPSTDWSVALPELASQIDDSLDEACATMRFPRPIIVLSPGQAITEQHAA